MTTELINSLKETISLLELEYNREAKTFECETDYIDKTISQQRLDQLEDTIKQLERCIRDFSNRGGKGFVRFDDELILTDEERKAKEKNLMDHLKRSIATSNPSIQLYSQSGEIVAGGEVKINSDEVPDTKKDIGEK